MKMQEIAIKDNFRSFIKDDDLLNVSKKFVNDVNFIREFILSYEKKLEQLQKEKEEQLRI